MGVRAALRRGRPRQARVRGGAPSRQAGVSARRRREGDPVEAYLAAMPDFGEGAPGPVSMAPGPAVRCSTTTG